MKISETVVFVLIILLFLSGGDILEIIKVNNIDFKVNVIYKRYNKRIYLRVKNGQLYITTPTKLTAFSISQMIKANFNSIIKSMNESTKIEDKIHYLGESYHLILRESKTNTVYIDGDSFIIETTNTAIASKLVDSFYITTLKKIVKTYENYILSQFNITEPVTFSYKNVKGYYGECFPKKRKIILSTKLAKYDPKYILSVIYHEFAHFKYQNHQKEFYDYLEEVYPNYRKVQHAMRSIKYNELYWFLK